MKQQHFVLFILILILSECWLASAAYTCYGVSGASKSVCSGHGICQDTNNCYCVDSVSTVNTIFSSSGFFLTQGNYLVSGNGVYELDMLTNGNLVLYKSGSILWKSDTSGEGSGSYLLSLSSDGTLSIKGTGGSSLVKELSGSCGGTAPYRLVVQNDGNVVLYGANKEVCWETNTNSGSAVNVLWTGSSCGTSTFSCYGTVASSSSVCSGHGDCTFPNTCTCDSGYSGSTCTTYYCNSVLPTSKSVCNGNGNCTKPNTCSCKSGYNGTYCQDYYCNGVIHSNSEVCGGLGSCVAPETCNCTHGTYGSNCEYFDCGQVRYDNDTVCSGRGSCESSNNCTCETPYFGENCENYYCNGVINNASMVCSGHGDCSAPEVCSCKEGYFGEDCQWFECNGLLRNESSVCSGYGNCTAYNVCQCDEHRIGSDCEQFLCYGMGASNSSVCSGAGNCFDYNSCSCYEHYSGDNCEIFNCFNISNNDSSVCTGHGYCNRFDLCSCNYPYYGNECSLFDCYQVEHLNSSVCSSHGECSSPSNCTCQDGYHGNKCEVHNCFGILYNTSNVVCSGHGQCLSPDSCSCNAGYYGSECSEFDCFGIYKNDSNVCSEHGQCLAPNTCSCVENYFAFDCSNHRCFDILYNDTNVCSGHGACHLPDNCTCQEGYYGTMCEKHDCFGLLYNDSSSCSTHGQCISPNNCSCTSGYYNEQCSDFDCFGIYKNDSNACYGHGQCLSPNNCSCSENYFSFDCSNHRCFGILYNASSVCSGHGACHLPDNCTCNNDYFGTTCELHNCFGTLFNESTVCSSQGQCISPNKCSCSSGFTSADCSVNISPFQIELSQYEQVVYLEFDNKNVSVDILVVDEALKSSNLSYSWTCLECDGENVKFQVISNRLLIESTLNDVTQYGNYTFIANSSIANIEPFESRKSNSQKFNLIVKYELNIPSLETFGLPSVLVSNTQDQTFSTVISSITLNRTTIRNFLSCTGNCSTILSYSWSLTSGSFNDSAIGNALAQYTENSNQMTFSPSISIQSTIPSSKIGSIVTLTFAVYNSKQQTITSTVNIQVISPATPSSIDNSNSTSGNSLIKVTPTTGMALNDWFTISVSSWTANSNLLPLYYAVGYYDNSKSKSVRLTEYSLNTTFTSYLPYLRTSTSKSTRKSRKTLDDSSSQVEIVVFVKDVLGNIETVPAINVTISPFNGTQEEYIQIISSLSGESVLVASADQTFSTRASTSLVTTLISKVEIDPKNPSSALESLESLTSNNSSLTAEAVNQATSKVNVFLTNMTSTYLSELDSYGFVKSTLSTTDIATTVSVLSNLLSTSFNSEQIKETANLLANLIYYGIIPTVLDSTSTTLTSTIFTSNLIIMSVASFNLPVANRNSQTLSVDSYNNVSMNLTSIMTSYEAFSMKCGASLIVYNKNTNYDSSVNNLTLSSTVNDFKFMKKTSVLILKNLDIPLLLNFKVDTLPNSVTVNSTTTTNSTYHCKYWDDTYSSWSSSGCSVNGKTSTSVQCSCSHTTMFTTFLESSTSSVTIQLRDQVSSLYYAQIAFGILYLIVASGILIGLIVLRKSQPVSSRLLTPYVGLVALIVECTLIYIVQRSVLVDQLYSSNSQMWEAGDTAANIIANIVMIIVNTLNLTAIFCYVMQVFRFQFMKLLYKKLSDNRTKVQSQTVMKALRYSTSAALFYSLVSIFAAVNILYWTLWVILRRTEVLSSTQYTYIVSVSYTCCIFAFGVLITCVAILDMVLSTTKEVKGKRNKRHAVNFSKPSSSYSMEETDIPKKPKNFISNAFNWLITLDGPLYFRLEMLIFIISFILLILNQVIGMSSLSYRSDNLAMFKIALTFDSISFIFEVLYIISYLFVFGGYALIVAIIYKMKQRKTVQETQQKQDEEIMNQELYNTLEHEDGYELFAKFCEKEFSSENLFLFSDLKTNSDVVSGENLTGLPYVNDKIYNQYIKTGASHEVNIPSKSRNAFVQLYEKTRKVSESTSSLELMDVTSQDVKDCFELMTRQVVMNLGDTFSRFVFIPDYLEFKEVRNVQMQIIEKANTVYGI